MYLSVPPAAETRARMMAQFDPRLVVVFPDTSSLLPDGVTAPVAAVGPVPGVPLRLDMLAAAQPRSRCHPGPGPADLAVVISSGGTTGVPKGSRRDFAAYAAYVTVPAPAPDRRQLANGKLAYLTQVLVDRPCSAAGPSSCRTFRPRRTLDAIEASGSPHLFLVEPQLFGLMDHPAMAHRTFLAARAHPHRRHGRARPAPPRPERSGRSSPTPTGPARSASSAR